MAACSAVRARCGGAEVIQQPMSTSDNVPSYEDLIAIASVFPVGLPAIVEELKQVDLPFDEHVRQIRLTYGDDIDADRFALLVRKAVAQANRS